MFDSQQNNVVFAFLSIFELVEFHAGDPFPPITDTKKVYKELFLSTRWI